MCMAQETYEHLIKAKVTDEKVTRALKSEAGYYDMTLQELAGHALADYVDNLQEDRFEVTDEIREIT